MANAEAAPDTIYITYIRAAPEQVWAALTQAAYTTQYFFGRRVESDWRVGSEWTLYTPDGRVDVNGKVLESDRPRRLVITWHVDLHEQFRHLPDSIVSYDIEPMGDVVKLTMTEHHPEPIPLHLLEGGKQGWPAILSSLKSLLETGKAFTIRMSPPKAPD